MELGVFAVAPDYYFSKGRVLTTITDIKDLLPIVNAKPDGELLSDLDATVAWAASQAARPDFSISAIGLTRCKCELLNIIRLSSNPPNNPITNSGRHIISRNRSPTANGMSAYVSMRRWRNMPAEALRPRGETGTMRDLKLHAWVNESSQKRRVRIRNRVLEWGG